MLHGAIMNEVQVAQIQLGCEGWSFSTQEGLKRSRSSVQTRSEYYMYIHICPKSPLNASTEVVSGNDAVPFTI